MRSVCCEFFCNATCDGKCSGQTGAFDAVQSDETAEAVGFRTMYGEVCDWLSRTRQFGTNAGVSLLKSAAYWLKRFLQCSPCLPTACPGP